MGEVHNELFRNGQTAEYTVWGAEINAKIALHPVLSSDFSQSRLQLAVTPYAPA